MAFQIPTTAELTSNNVAALESNLGQTAPLNPKSLLRVLAAMDAAQATGNYKFAAYMAKQNNVLSATGVYLDAIGIEVGVLRKAAVSAQYTITLPAVTGTVIPAATEFVAPNNGVRYSADAGAVAAAGVATIDVTAITAGVIGNLSVGDTMAISSPIAGADSVATITVDTTTGSDEETDAEYRIRVGAVKRVVTGGGNSADYRIWAQEVAGVNKAYPFADNPVSVTTPAVPLERTVYIEATTAVDPDGIAPQSLLNDVKAAIITDPDTGLERVPLGPPASLLYVHSITRSSFYVTVRNLQVDGNQMAQAQVDIETALELYFASIEPFVCEIDDPDEQNDTISSASVSDIVQDVVKGVGGYVESVEFGLSYSTPSSIYTLGQNELGALGGVQFV